MKISLFHNDIRDRSWSLKNGSSSFLECATFHLGIGIFLTLFPLPTVFSSSPPHSVNPYLSFRFQLRPHFLREAFLGSPSESRGQGCACSCSLLLNPRHPSYSAERKNLVYTFQLTGSKIIKTDCNSFQEIGLDYSEQQSTQNFTKMVHLCYSQKRQRLETERNNRTI